MVFKRGQKKLKESAAQTYAPNVKTVSVSRSINLLRLYKKWKNTVCMKYLQGPELVTKGVGAIFFFN